MNVRTTESNSGKRTEKTANTVGFISTADGLLLKGRIIVGGDDGTRSGDYGKTVSYIEVLSLVRGRVVCNFRNNLKWGNALSVYLEAGIRRSGTGSFSHYMRIRRVRIRVSRVRVKVRVRLGLELALGLGRLWCENELHPGVPLRPITL